MLILTRKVGETIMIGDEVSITILAAKSNQISFGINAPSDIAVHGEEVYYKIQAELDTSSVSVDNNGFLSVQNQRSGFLLTKPLSTL